MTIGKSLIAGNWEEGQGSFFSSSNPIDGSKLGEWKGVSPSQIQNPPLAASAAYWEIWEIKSFDFDKWAAEIEALGDELLPVCNAQTGLGFHASGANKMNEIGRSPENLVAQVVGENHQCPDGLVLFLGTMFAPTENRDANSNGFTHKIGDKVIISFPKLGQLINWVNTCDQLPRWEFGIHSFIDFCIKRAAC